MANKIDKKATFGGILQVVLTPILIIVIGTIFSLLTGYKANNYPFAIRFLVWMMNLIISWLLVSIFLKLFFHKKISILSYKYMFFAYVLSALFVWSIGYEENDYSYVTASLTLVTIIGTIWGIKFLKLKRGRPLKK